MQQSKKDNFLKEVLSYIKFPFDRNDIKTELEGHILDKIEFYKEKGYDEEKSEELSVKDMGDAREIGIELNKQHNPLIGWVVKITNIIVVLLGMFAVYFIGATLLISIFTTDLTKDIPESNIVYRIDLDERVKIDDRIIDFTSVIYDKNGDMHIFYEHYNTSGAGWGFSYIGEIKDDLGNAYFTGGGRGTGGIKPKGRRTVSDFSEEASKLIIDYDQYNRSYKVEIPLQVGDDSA